MDEDLSQNGDRYPRTLFNQFAYFGQEISVDDWDTPPLTLSSKRALYEIFDSSQMNMEHLIKIFIQSALLDAFFSQDFPAIAEKKRIVTHLDGLLSIIHKIRDIHESNITQIFTMLLLKIKENLEEIFLLIQQRLVKKSLTIMDVKDFEFACRGFQKNVVTNQVS